MFLISFKTSTLTPGLLRVVFLNFQTCRKISKYLFVTTSFIVLCLQHTVFSFILKYLFSYLNLFILILINIQRC